MAGVRRTWDKDYYEQKALERAEKGEDYDKIETAPQAKTQVREEFKPAEEGAAGPMGSTRAFVQPRQSKIDLDSKVGKVEVINPASAESAHGAGFWCEVCQILSKDSVSYLDHINGKRHQQSLGFSMRTERANVDSVKKKLEELKNQRLNKKTAPVVTYTKEEQFEMYESKLKEERDEEEARKKRRKEEFQAFKEAKKQKTTEENEEGDSGNEDAGDIAQMLGFKGFGSSKK